MRIVYFRFLVMAFGNGAGLNDILEFRVNGSKSLRQSVTNWLNYVNILPCISLNSYHCGGDYQFSNNALGGRLNPATKCVN